MKREIITISDAGRVTIPCEGEVWMTTHEIARLLGCFVSKITANVRSILKAEGIHAHKLCRSIGVEFYNLEMIIALAFRVRSYESDIFRQWVIKRAVRGPISQIPVFIPLDEDTVLN